MRVLWQADALVELEAIGDHIAGDRPAAAERVVLRIQEHVAVLETHPHLGRMGRVTGTRELVVPSLPYIVAYRVEEEEVQILSVRHGAWQWPKGFGDKPE